jgi:hypothetical protein
MNFPETCTCADTVNPRATSASATLDELNRIAKTLRMQRVMQLYLETVVL